MIDWYKLKQQQNEAMAPYSNSAAIQQGSQQLVSAMRNLQVDNNMDPSYTMQNVYKAVNQQMESILLNHDKGTALKAIEENALLDNIEMYFPSMTRQELKNNLSPILKMATGIDIDKNGWQAFSEAYGTWTLQKKLARNERKMAKMDPDSEEYKKAAEYSDKLQLGIAKGNMYFRDYGWLGNEMIENGALTAQLAEQGLYMLAITTASMLTAGVAGGIMGASAGVGFATGYTNMLSAMNAAGGTIATSATGLPYVTPNAAIAGVGGKALVDKGTSSPLAGGIMDPTGKLEGAASRVLAPRGSASAIQYIQAATQRIKTWELSQNDAGSFMYELRNMTDSDGNRIPNSVIDLAGTGYGLAIFFIEDELLSLVNPIAKRFGATSALQKINGLSDRLENAYKTGIVGSIGRYLISNVGESLQEGWEEVNSVGFKFVAKEISDIMGATNFNQSAQDALVEAAVEGTKTVAESLEAFGVANLVPGFLFGTAMDIPGWNIIQNYQASKQEKKNRIVSEQMRAEADKIFKENGVTINIDNIDTGDAQYSAKAEEEIKEQVKNGKLDEIKVSLDPVTRIRKPVTNEDAVKIETMRVAGMTSAIKIRDVNLTATPADMNHQEMLAFKDHLATDMQDSIIGTSGDTLFVNGQEAMDQVKQSLDHFDVRYNQKGNNLLVYGNNDEGQAYSFTVRIADESTKDLDYTYTPFKERDTSNLTQDQVNEELRIEASYNAIKDAVPFVSDAAAYNGAQAMEDLAAITGKSAEEIRNEGVVFFQEAAEDEIARLKKKYNMPEGEIIKGWMTPEKEGDRNVFKINVSHEATASTLAHEIGHIIRAVSTPEQLSGFVGLEGFDGTSGGMWSSDIHRTEDGRYRLGARLYDTYGEAMEAVRKNEEKFVQMFLQYKKDGIAPNESVASTFQRMSDFINAIRMGYDKIDISPEARAALDQLYNASQKGDFSRANFDGSEVLETTYHGAAANFDAFDFSKMGSGEGGQMFGWGGYVTQGAGIGKEYAKADQKRKTWGFSTSVSDEIMNYEFLKSEYQDVLDTITKAIRMKLSVPEIMEILENNPDIDENRPELIDIMEDLQNGEIDEARKDAEELVADVDRELKELKAKTNYPRRNLYKVEIPDDLGIPGSRYLDWDKKVGVKEIQRIVNAMADEYGGTIHIEDAMDEDDYKNWTGEQLYHYMENFYDTVDLDAPDSGKRPDELTSKMLHKLGYTGNRYEAERRTRKPGQPARYHNFVIFDENDMNIVQHWTYDTDEEGAPLFETVFRENDRKISERVKDDWDNIERDIQQHPEKYYTAEGDLRAPNGKKSNLSYDNYVMVRTPAFINWFGDWINDPENASKVVDENGEPLVEFHGTMSYGFDTFRVTSYAEFGAHFGTRTTAEIILDQQNAGDLWDFENDGEPIYQVFLNIRNPIENVGDVFVAPWGFVGVMEERGMLAGEEGQSIKALADQIEEIDDRRAAAGLSTELSKKINSYLKHLGYDGVKYTNGYEEVGSTSWIALSPNQIKSVNNNGEFSRTNDNILFQTATSAGTSVMNQIPAAYGAQREALQKWTSKNFGVDIYAEGQTNFEQGMGRSDTATEHLKSLGVRNIGTDPFNRTPDFNNQNARRAIKEKVDTSSAMNVLNVIDDDNDMELVIAQSALPLKEGGVAIFQVYEGDRSGESKYKANGTQYQRNMKGADYVPYVEKYYSDVKAKGNVIVAKNPKMDVINEATGGRFSFEEEPVLFETKLLPDINSQIESITENDIGKVNEYISVSATTPDVFVLLGMQQLPIGMYKDKLARGLYLDESRKHGHSGSIDKEIVTEMLNTFADPLLVFDSASTQGALVAIYDVLDKNGNNVLVSIEYNPEKPNLKFNAMNFITSIYGKDNSKVFNTWAEKGLLRYIDDTKKETGKYSVSLQLASGLPASGDKVIRKSEIVNKNTIELFETGTNPQVYTDNFKNWFGDWQNDPENASKVVNEDGTPKVLYHGSPISGIEIFSPRGATNNGEGLIYATNEKGVADLYALEHTEGASAYTMNFTGRQGEVYPLYMNMKHPLDFRNLSDDEKDMIITAFMNSWHSPRDLAENVFNMAYEAGNHQYLKDMAKNIITNLPAYSYDGLIANMLTNWQAEQDGAQYQEYAVASPTQVKSADRNSGAFNPVDENILFETTAEKIQNLEDKKRQIIAPYARDIERAVALGEFIADEYLAYFKDQQWAEDILQVREMLKEDPELMEDAKQSETFQEWLRTSALVDDTNITPELERYLELVYSQAHLFTPEQQDRVFAQEWTATDEKMLELSEKLSNYRTLASARQKRINPEHQYASRFGAYKGVSRDVLFLRRNDGTSASGKQYTRSTHEQIELAKKKVQDNPRPYRLAYLQAYGANENAQRTAAEYRDMMEYGVQNLNYKLDQLFGSVDEEIANIRRRQELIESGQGYKVTIEDLNAKIARAEEDLKDLQLDLNITEKELKDKLDRLQEQYNDERDLHNLYKNQVAELKKDQKADQKKIAAAEAKTEKARQKLETTRKERDRYKKGLDAARRKKEAVEARQNREKTIKKILKASNFNNNTLDVSYESIFAWVRNLFDPIDRKALYEQRRQLMSALSEAATNGNEERAAELTVQLEDVRQRIKASEQREVPENARTYFNDAIMQKADNRQSAWTQEELDYLLNVVKKMRDDARLKLEQRVAARNARRQKEAADFFEENYGTRPVGFIREDVADYKGYDQYTREIVSNASVVSKVDNLNIQRVARIVDNDREGVAYDLLVRRVWQAAANETRNVTRRADAGLKRFKALKLTFEQFNKKGYEYTVQKKDGPLKIALTRGEMLGVYVYTRNNDGAQKIMSPLGNDIPYETAIDIINKLTDAERAWGDYLIWDMSTDAYDRTQAVNVNEYNMIMGKQPNYYPLVAQGKNEEGEDILTGPRNDTKRYAESGFRKERNHYAVYALDLDVNSQWLKQVRRQEHFIAFAAWSREANYLLGRGGMGDVIKKKYGDRYLDNIQDYVNYISSSKSTMDASDRIFSGFLSRYAASKVVGKLGVMLKQLPTLSAALGNVSTKAFVQGVAGAIAPKVSLESFLQATMLLDPNGENYKNVQEVIFTNAPEMRSRRYGSLVMELDEKGKYKPVSLQGINNLGNSSFGIFTDTLNTWIGQYTMQVTDGFVTQTLWLGRYMTVFKEMQQDAKKQGVTFDMDAAHKEAAFKASQLISETQNTMIPMDMSRNMRKARQGNLFHKMTFMFGSATMNLFNEISEDLRYNWKNRKNPRNAKRLIGETASIIITLTALMGIGGALFRKKGEDDEEYAARIAAEGAAQAVSTLIPGYGSSIAEAYKGYSGSSTMSLFEDAGKITKKATNIKSWESALDLIGMLATTGASAAGLPADAASKIWKSIAEENPGYLINSNWAEWFERKFK